MNCSILTRVLAPNLLPLLALSMKIVGQQPNVAVEDSSKKLRYDIIDVGPVGPPPGQPFMVSHNDLTIGSGAGPDGTEHATLWLGSARLDLGTPGLGGPNSLGLGVNERALAVGGAQTTDANAEDFCGFNAYGFPPSNTTCLPFFWRYGVMHPLPTLGGPNGYAYMINDRGDVAGLAETSTQDAGCSVHRFQPVVWTDGKPHALPTPGDLYGVAAFNNEKGQVVGASGSCTSFNTNTGLYLNEIHPLFWNSDGRAYQLPTLGGAGGVAGNHACSLNNLGQAVGHSELTNNTTFHATFWPKTNKVVDLGTLEGDYASLALGINDNSTVVGASLDANFNPRAYFWKHNVITDLNTLVRNSSGLYLLLAESINHRGVIVGFGATSAGDVHGFLAVPTDGEGNFDADTTGLTAVSRPVLSDSAREQLRSKLARLHVGPPH
jgi:probable HAF family extracellular repeat protein